MAVPTARVAPGRPLWGAYTLAAIDEALGEDGRPRATFTVRSPDRTVVIAFGPEEPGAAAPFYASPLGALRVVSDDRTADECAGLAHQVERCLGFHFSRAVPPDAVWGPPPGPDDGEAP